MRVGSVAAEIETRSRRMTRRLDSYAGRATFVVEDDATFDADCQYIVEQDMIKAGSDLLPGMISWRGTFSTDTPIVKSGNGTITLADGRVGKVVITHVRIPNGTGSFVGSGDAPSWRRSLRFRAPNPERMTAHRAFPLTSSPESSKAATPDLRGGWCGDGTRAEQRLRAFRTVP
jgi:hypothetical protein